jgi:hypothetical protein
VLLLSIGQGQTPARHRLPIKCCGCDQPAGNLNAHAAFAHWVTQTYGLLGKIQREDDLPLRIRDTFDNSAERRTVKFYRRDDLMEDMSMATLDGSLLRRYKPIKRRAIS